MSSKSYFTIEETISIPYLSSPAVSEDGKQLAWVKTVPNWDKNEYSKRVQVYDLKTGLTPEFGAGHQSVAPAWSFQGRLAWLSTVGEGRWGLDITTLELLDTNTNKTSQPLVDFDECIYPLRWTKRGLVFGWQQKTDWYVGLLTTEGYQPLRDAPGSVTMESSVSSDGAHLGNLNRH